MFNKLQAFYRLNSTLIPSSHAGVRFFNVSVIADSPDAHDWISVGLTRDFIQDIGGSFTFWGRGGEARGFENLNFTQL